MLKLETLLQNSVVLLEVLPEVRLQSALGLMSEVQPVDGLRLQQVVARTVRVEGADSVLSEQIAHPRLLRRPKQALAEIHKIKLKSVVLRLTCGTEQ